MPPQPRAGGAGAAFKWGGSFGAVVGAVNLIQVLVGVAAVNTNLGAINSYQSSQEFQAYEQCVAAGGNTSGCPMPVANDGIAAALTSFYGSCFFIFLLTLVVYALAATFAARATGRRGPGIWAALIAATLGTVLYFIAGVVAIASTGRTGLFAGLGPLLDTDSGTWSVVLIFYTVIADTIGLLMSLGAAALVGLLGTAIGLRGTRPTGYAPPPFAPPYPPPGAPSAYGAPPPFAPYASPYAPAGAMPAPPAPPPVAPAPPAPDYSLPAQYPPLPSDYETPPHQEGNTGHS